jgi:hypothetical protein
MKEITETQIRTLQTLRDSLYKGQLEIADRFKGQAKETTDDFDRITCLGQENGALTVWKYTYDMITETISLLQTQTNS